VCRSSSRCEWEWCASRPCSPVLPPFPQWRREAVVDTPRTDELLETRRRRMCGYWYLYRTRCGPFLRYLLLLLWWWIQVGLIVVRTGSIAPRCSPGHRGTRAPTGGAGGRSGPMVRERQGQRLGSRLASIHRESRARYVPPTAWPRGDMVRHE
jgi:hypothetical protein